ncbi:dephospho-CoA kinase [Bacillus sp. FJAT-42315]|uniref:dephospho-CoA kinase n=1 Tax=Bacillus sp. FJAT-42315 TaxID=2014077 RepID=UPI000C238C7C|nr:dephospho-CoA kinase [Bacillus sp. FJAT-42315]
MVNIIGLTGGIASGKSTVSQILEGKGFTIVDADVAARAVVEPGQPALTQIIETFGEGILQEDGSLDRLKLGKRIFNNEAERKKLNGIVHPAVRQFMLAEKEAAIEAGKKTIIMDIPLLFESQLTWMVEKVIVVYVNEDTQLHRLMARNDFDEATAKSRISSQLSLDDKAAQADVVINNNGTLEETKEQLEQILIDWHLQP